MIDAIYYVENLERGNILTVKYKTKIGFINKKKTNVDSLFSDENKGPSA